MEKVIARALERRGGDLRRLVRDLCETPLYTLDSFGNDLLLMAVYNVAHGSSAIPGVPTRHLQPTQRDVFMDMRLKGLAVEDEKSAFHLSKAVLYESAGNAAP